MELKNKIQADLKESILSKNSFKTSVLRLVLSSIYSKEKDLQYKKEEFTEEITQEIVFSEAKKRKDSIQEYTKGNRPELADKEKKELDIILQYLPTQFTEDEVRTIVQEEIKNNNITDIKQMGLAMSKIMPRVKGKSDGQVVGKILKEELSK